MLPLTALADRLDEAAIRAACVLPSALCDLVLFDEIPSTSDYLKMQAHTLLQPGKMVACLANSQTQGRGQFSRTWYSPANQNIYLSLLYPFQKKAEALSGLSLVVSLVLSELLQADYTTQPIYVKWPNDVMCVVAGVLRKIAGVLVEIITTTTGDCAVVVGVGLNVNMMHASSEHLPPWISLKQITGQTISRNVLVARLLNQLWHALHLFALQGLAPFQASWATRDILFDKTITLHCADRALSGVMRGINHCGHLRLQIANGECLSFSSGEAAILNPLGADDHHHPVLS